MSPVISPALADAGLVLQAALPVDRLDVDVCDSLTAVDVNVDDFESLLLFGQAGRRLFEEHVADELDRPDPFDTTSVELVTAWLRESHPDARFAVVYPGPCPLPLGHLAEQVGWGRASPLGLTIHADYGLWVAHRVAVLVDVAIITTAETRPHPCDSCPDTPCVPACPVGAVSVTRAFDLDACAHHRIAEDSPCAYECLARNACPVGAEHRYGPVQMRHHYGAGLRTIHRWLAPDAQEGRRSGIESEG